MKSNLQDITARGWMRGGYGAMGFNPKYFYLIDGEKSNHRPDDPDKKYLCFSSEKSRSEFIKVNSGELKTYPRKQYSNRNWKKN